MKKNLGNESDIDSRINLVYEKECDKYVKY